MAPWPVQWVLGPGASEVEKFVFLDLKLFEKFVVTEKKKNKSWQWRSKADQVLSWSSGVGWKILTDGGDQVVMEQQPKDEGKEQPYQGADNWQAWSSKDQEWVEMPHLKCKCIQQPKDEPADDDKKKAKAAAPERHVFFFVVGCSIYI